MQWAMHGRLDDEPLLEACLSDQRFDVQCEDSRADWLWQIVQTVGATQRFRVPILHALYELSDERSADQLCELARCYAEIGDETFRDRLYEIVELRPFAQIPWLGEEQIIQLDGERAFLFAARVRGQQLATCEWEWDDGSLMTQAVECFGEERAHHLLEASSDTAVAKFLENWQREQRRKAEWKQSKSPKERNQAVPVEEIIRAAKGTTGCYWFRVWGMHADEAKLHGVLRHLSTVDQPRVIANLLRVFMGRALPEFDARLIELCRHDDENVRRLAFCASKKNTHALIREFAVTELQKGGPNDSVVGLFINNYKYGDEQLILEAMELPGDACELHWLLMDVIDVLEKNPEADCSRLGLIAYASTPCENCRFEAARLLFEKQVAPPWLREECRYDSGKDCRDLAQKSNGSAGTR
jgi:hypothetical protein